MARTPLARALRCLFADHAAARARGLPVGAVRALRAATRGRQESPRAALTRRAFLAGAGAGLGALAVSAFPPAPRARGLENVVVVGGGIAGLACALHLADQGIAATIYEASGRIGGRIFTNDGGYWEGGQVSEWGGELIDTGHATMRRLASRFDLRLDNLLEAQPAGSSDTFFFFGDYYTTQEADRDFAPVFEAVKADLEAAGYPTRFDSHTRAGRALDLTSAYDWIERRVPGGHKSPLGALLDVAYATEYGSDTTDQASLNLVYLLGAQPAGATSFRELGESDEAFRIRGGNQQLTRAIGRHLGDDAFRLGHRLVRIRQMADGRFQLTFERSGRTAEIAADHVVLAIPFSVLRYVNYAAAGFDARKVDAIRRLGGGRNGKLQLQFSDRFWTGPGPWSRSNGSGYSNTGYQATWDATRGQEGSPGILVFYNGGSVTNAQHSTGAFTTASDARVRRDAQTALAQAEHVFPGLRARWKGKATQSVPHRSDLFRASYAYYRVGQYTAFAGHEGTQQGNAYFCGDHTSPDFQGFMEGGASEGERVASELARRLVGRRSARAPLA